MNALATAQPSSIAPDFVVALVVRTRCETWKRFLELHDAELSRGVLFVPTALGMPLGTEVSIELALPTNKRLTIPAEVIDAIHDGDALRRGRPVGLALMFRSLPDEVATALDAAVDHARASVLGTTMPSPIAPPEPARGPRPVFGDVVSKTLSAELTRRGGLGPYEQLGLSPGASEDAIHEATRQLTERYHPVLFERYGKEVLALADDIVSLIRAAYAELRDPSSRGKLEAGSDLRAENARRSLRASVDARIVEGRRLAAADQLDEAIRALEGALMIERGNTALKDEIKALRERQAALLAARQHRGLFQRLRCR